MLSAYIRYGSLARSDDFLEAGVLLKFPLGFFPKRRGGGHEVCYLTSYLCP